MVVLAVNLRGVEVGPLPGLAALDALPKVFLAGGDVALKDLVQGDAAEAQADDLVGHLEEQSTVLSATANQCSSSSSSHSSLTVSSSTTSTSL